MCDFGNERDDWYWADLCDLYTTLYKMRGNIRDQRL